MHKKKTYAINRIQFLQKINTRFLFTGFAAFFIILSFLPFLGWLDYVSRNVGKLPYLNQTDPVRRPGELPNEVYQEHKDDILRWFFFEYYIGWRYDNPSPNEDYNMWNAVHSAFADPIFVTMIPIFFIGLFAFYKTRKISDGLLYSGWFFSTLLVFLPASFQLNYYYLACFLPFYLIVAKGIVFMFQESRAWWGYEYLAVILSVLVFGFIIHHYSLLRYKFVSLSVGSLTLIEGNLIPLGPYLDHFDVFLLFVGILLTLTLLFWVRSEINIIGLGFVFIVVLSSLLATSYNVKVGGDWDSRLEEIANFVLDHEGNYNQSTWVFADAGIQYGMRYYLGFEIFEQRDGNPFPRNSEYEMEEFISDHPQIKFWMVLNDTYRHDDLITGTQAYYETAYLWLKQNYVCVDNKIGIPDWYPYHLFVDSDVL